MDEKNPTIISPSNTIRLLGTIILLTVKQTRVVRNGSRTTQAKGSIVYLRENFFTGELEIVS